jgi:hypothetical protein
VKYSIQETLRFPPVDGLTVRGEFDGGALSSDFGPMILRGMDRQIGLTKRLAQALRDPRHPSYITHSLQTLFAQRTDPIARADADGHDANAPRADPLFKLGLERRPLDEATDLARAPTVSRLEPAASPQALDRVARAFVDHVIASDAKPPAGIVLELDPSEDAAHGRQELIFYHHHYDSHGDLPLFMFEGLSGQFITVALRPGQRPTSAENAAIVQGC